MKYFEETREENVIGMPDDYGDGKHVLHIEKSGNFINFVEGCDHYYSRMMSKEEAIEALKEAIAWIESEE